MTFWSQLFAGSPILWLILFSSITAFMVFIAKWFQFHRAQVDIKELVTGLANVLRRNGYMEAITLCDNTPGPVARILGSGIKAYANGDDVKQAIGEAAVMEIPRLEKYLTILSTIAKTAPMLGLLGTVFGMADVFAGMQTKMGGAITLSDLSGGVSEALFVTAAGLALSIPAYIAYNYLVSRVESLALDMEKASTELVNFFQHHAKGEQ